MRIMVATVDLFEGYVVNSGILRRFRLRSATHQTEAASATHRRTSLAKRLGASLLFERSYSLTFRACNFGNSNSLVALQYSSSLLGLGNQGRIQA